MEKETKKSLVSGSLVAGGLVAAAVTLGVMQGDKSPEVETIDQQAVVRSVAAEVRREIQAQKTEYVEAPDKIHADTMLWLNQHEERVNAKVAEQDKVNARMAEVIEKLTTQLADVKSVKNDKAPVRTSLWYERIAPLLSPACRRATFPDDDPLRPGASRYVHALGVLRGIFPSAVATERLEKHAAVGRD